MIISALQVPPDGVLKTEFSTQGMLIFLPVLPQMRVSSTQDLTVIDSKRSDPVQCAHLTHLGTSPNIPMQTKLLLTSKSQHFKMLYVNTQ